MQNVAIVILYQLPPPVYSLKYCHLRLLYFLIFPVRKLRSVMPFYNFYFLIEIVYWVLQFVAFASLLFQKYRPLVTMSARLTIFSQLSRSPAKTAYSHARTQRGDQAIQIQRPNHERKHCLILQQQHYSNKWQ